MPVVSCPKCPTKLKIPDGVSGNTRCPKCGTIFPVSASSPFEVVGDKAAPGQQPAQAPAKPKADDFDDDKPKKRVTADEDDDDDKPRKKKKRYDDDDDEDDDDDRPRSKKKKRRDDDDDDDDDDDRPRRKKKKKRRRDYDDDYDDDEEDWRPGPSTRGDRGGFANGKTGALLMGISFWLNLGAFGLLALYALIGWLLVLAASSSSPGRGGGGGRGGSGGDGSFAEILVVLPGLIGLGAWIVGTVGCAFSIAGPARARGMAITATVLAGVHLVLTGVTFSNMHGTGGGFGMGRMGIGSPAWIIVASTLPVLDSMFPVMFYGSRLFNQGEYIIALLAAICELMRLIFMLVTLKQMAAAARDHHTAEKAGFGLMLIYIIAGAVAAFVLLMVVLMAESKFKSFETYAHLVAMTMLFTYLAYTFMMLNPAIAALMTKSACEARG